MPAVWAEECAWHPKYHGHRRIVFLVPIPKGMTPEEFGKVCEREHRTTHGICVDCRPIFSAEIKAAKERRKPNPVPLLTAALIKRHAISRVVLRRK